jgi:hypothetical protein
MRYFESDLFIQRLVKEFGQSQNSTCLFLQSSEPGNISFQFQTRKKMMDYIWANIGWIGKEDEFYELLIYTMYVMLGLIR